MATNFCLFRPNPHSVFCRAISPKRNEIGIVYLEFWKSNRKLCVICRMARHFNDFG